ncbi:MAG TPA: ParB/RepB/Spo0J family partition protein [Chloroflexota bacterium]|nr:ParB/RepB/Spo0J family partition protein [Chloroflexota bacterium]HUM67867.1 ParB/RepB/Spo0J family partition protein [Chloroflexota bacterium]
MTRKRPKVSLSQPIKPQSGDLQKLFTAQDDVEQSAGMQLLAIRLDAIQPDGAQPRRSFPTESLQELSDSIQQDGVIQPIEVTEIRPNHYLIVHGERRWRAAKMAGLETIPAVVRRRDYDETTRFVRQLVENIQREDLNDVDRAGGLLHLRDLLQDELEKAQVEGVSDDQPWGNKITWAKVGQRLGYSRQRIHQLIQLLNLPDEIKEDVRDGRISEKDTRIYQGLKPSQQRALHKARIAGDITTDEAKNIARILKENPDRTVYQTIRDLRKPAPDFLPETKWTEPDASVLPDTTENLPPLAPFTENLPPLAPFTSDSLTTGLAPGTTRVTNITRLSYIRQHLARIQREDLHMAERQEIIRLLQLIEQDVRSLIEALSTD